MKRSTKAPVNSEEVPAEPMTTNIMQRDPPEPPRSIGFSLFKGERA